MSKKLLIFLLAVAASMLAVPALASATVYCVDDTPAVLTDNGGVDPSCETPIATLAEALTAAGTHSGTDTVLLGSGELALPAKAGGNEADYNSADPSNVLILKGTGQTHLTMGATTGVQTGISVFAPAGSRVEGLAVTVPANVDASGDTAFRLGTPVAGRDLRVEGPAATNARGFILGGGTSLENAAVLFPVASAAEDTGISATSGGAIAVTDSHIEAGAGFQLSGSTVEVDRSLVVADNGFNVDSGKVAVRDSVIDLGAVNSSTALNLANYNAGSLSLAAEISNDTIVGGGSNSVGVRVLADNGQETAKATIAGTVIEGPAHAIQVLADNGRAASATVSYSNYDTASVELREDLDGTGEKGLLTFNATAVAHASPGFVNAPSGDFHLAPGSALIDAGEPGAPPVGELDIEGQARASSSSCPLLAGRRDIGADEFLPTCGPEALPAPNPTDTPGSVPGTSPEVTPTAPRVKAFPATAIAGKHRVMAKSARATVTLRLSSSAPGSSFRCSVDGGAYRACRAALKLHLKPGRHTVAAIASDAAGSDLTPARFTVRVVG